MNKIILGANEARKIAKTVALCVSTDKTRYYLNGVCLEGTEREGVRAVATDGHRLANLKLNPLVVKDDKLVPGTAKHEFDVIMPRDAVEWLGKLPRKVTSLHTVSFEFDKTVLALSFWEWDRLQSTAHFKLIDRNFPDFRRVTPSFPDTVPCTYLDAKYLMELCKAAIENNNGMKGEAAISLYFENHTGPVLLKAQDKSELVMVLVPKRM